MRTKRVGDHALLLLVDDPRSAVAVRNLVVDLASRPGQPGRAPLAAPVEIVPAARTVLVDGLPGPVAVERWQALLAGVSLHDYEAGRSDPPGEPVTIDVTYDGADLDVVARVWACSREAVVTRHTRTMFLVAFCGFVPGFAYCVAAEPFPEVPRREVPRERVPGGSVALAGEYCGVYPTATPGGWQLVGATSARLFDADRPEPALLSPGDRLRFRATSP
ncbi:MAG: hypothetical protein QOI51_2279 [Nocardioidaceae bacterium]|jgi:KipI family sensor histidine kinase inhibitor|nr:hypothetical protein [Nocardioidaceae bacterium]